MHEAVRGSAWSITDLAMSLHRVDMVRHLPQTGLSALVVAVFSHISDMLSPQESLHEAGLRGFEQCSHVLNELRENFYSADFSAEFVNLVAQMKSLVRPSVLTQTTYNQRQRNFDLDDQTSAQRKFLAEDLADNQSSTLAVSRPLPQALFPEDCDISRQALSDSDATRRAEHTQASLDTFQDQAAEQELIADPDYWGLY